MGTQQKCSSKQRKQRARFGPKCSHGYLPSHVKFVPTQPLQGREVWGRAGVTPASGGGLLSTSTHRAHLQLQPAPVGSTPIRVNLTQRAPTSTAIRGVLTRFKLGDSLFKKSWILGGKGERKFESTWTQIWIKHWKNIWDFRENHSPREGLVVNFVLTLHPFPTFLP